jgi:hypothetical protein
LSTEATYLAARVPKESHGGIQTVTDCPAVRDARTHPDLSRI